MTKQLTLIETLVAVELGCEWESDDYSYINHRGKTEYRFDAPFNQSLKNACSKVHSGFEIRLTDKEWDWPRVDENPKYHGIGWYKHPLDEGKKWLQGYVSGAYLYGFNNSGGLHGGFYVVVPDPRSPDAPPPSDWSPDGRRVVK